MPGPSISIALCTHNGARYLQAQLDSLSRQTAPPAELVIGDDASGDATLEIVERFCKSAPFPVRIIARSERLGHTENFFATARECRGAWIAFADQDDVWFDGKLAEVQAVIAAHPEVLLVNQRALLCDENLTPRSAAPFPDEPRPGLHPTPHRRLPLVWPGFLMTIRARLLHDFDPELRPTLPHDGLRIGHGRWAFLLAAALGSYYVTKAPSACYRRHPDALTGAYAPARRSRRDFRAASHLALQSQRDYARAMAPALERLAALAPSPDDRPRLARAARCYDRAEEALNRRMACYEGATLAWRLSAWLEAGWDGAYCGPPLHAGGTRAAAKDFLASLKAR